MSVIPFLLYVFYGRFEISIIETQTTLRCLSFETSCAVGNNCARVEDCLLCGLMSNSFCRWLV